MEYPDPSHIFLTSPISSFSFLFSLMTSCYVPLYLIYRLHIISSWIFHYISFHPSYPFNSHHYPFYPVPLRSVFSHPVLYHPTMPCTSIPYISNSAIKTRKLYTLLITHSTIINNQSRFVPPVYLILHRSTPT